jgi:hypothetical protein
MTGLNQLNILFLRKGDALKRGCLLIFDARSTQDKTKRVNYENMVLVSGGR